MLLKFKSSCLFTELLGQSWWAVPEVEVKSVSFCQSASGFSTSILLLGVWLELGTYVSVYISEPESLLIARSWHTFLRHRWHWLIFLYSTYPSHKHDTLYLQLTFKLQVSSWQWAFTLNASFRYTYLSKCDFVFVGKLFLLCPGIDTWG